MSGLRNALELANAGACGDPRVLVELAILAEASGWEAVLLEDYVVHHTGTDVPTTDPWTALAAVAVRTQRVLIGTEVTPVPRRRPWVLARQVVTVDLLSGGRAVLGVGTGDVNDPGFAGVGEVTDARQRGGMLDEALEIMVGLWSGEPVTFHGRHYRVEGMVHRPLPIQRPHPPIWVGGQWGSRRLLQRAARWGDGICTYKVEEGGFHLTVAEIRELRSTIATLRGGRLDGFDFVLGGTSRLDDAEAEREQRRVAADGGATWWVEYVPPGSYEAMRAAVAAGPLAW